MKSKPYKFQGKLFRYDFDNAIVEYISKADKEMLSDNEDWMERHGHNLWDIDEDGYVKLDGVGLRSENWKRKEARDEYLYEWCVDLDEESAALERDFVKYELPYLKEVQSK